MTANDGWSLLAETTVASSAAILLVLLLRRFVRDVFGARVLYALWAMVPVSLLAVLLPAAAEPVVPALAFALPVIDAPSSTATVTGAADSTLPWLGLIWAIGAVALLAGQIWQQRRFLAGLGPLARRPDGHLQSLAVRGLPAVIGWRTRIVLPSDFEQRYTVVERELVLAHEHEHLRRGDLYACLLAGLLRTVYWFNPLMHLAAVRLRADQELACDAAVLDRFPDRRRTYADAILKTRIAEQPLPFGCHWSGIHLMKERLAMLNRPTVAPIRRRSGALLAAMLCLFAGTLAWASQPAEIPAIPPGHVLLEAEIAIDGEPAHTIREAFSHADLHRQDFEHQGKRWDTSWKVTPRSDDLFDLVVELERDGESIASPRLTARDQATIRVGTESAAGSFEGISVEMRVTAGPPAPGMAAVGIQGSVPAYPPTAIEAGESGIVMLELQLNADGSVREAQVDATASTIAADSELARSTLDAARGWTIPPEAGDETPAARWVRVPVRFELRADRPRAETAASGA